MMVAWLGLLTPAQAQLEMQVKAALIVSLTNMATWDTPPPSFSIGIVGDNPFGPVLEAIAKQKNAPVKSFADAASVKGVNIIYVNPSKNGSIAEVVSGAPAGTLVIGEGDTFTGSGGMVSFVNRDGKVRFMLNEKAANAKGIKFSDRLKTLAVAS
jgi:hypothetical protein